MADPVTEEVAQREMLGAVATAARACGWLCLEMHLNRSNPKQMSQPDFLLIRPGSGLRFVKVLKSGDLSAPQTKIRRLLEAEGGRYDVYRPTPEDWQALIGDLA